MPDGGKLARAAVALVSACGLGGEGHQSLALFVDESTKVRGKGDRTWVTLRCDNAGAWTHALSGLFSPVETGSGISRGTLPRAHAHGQHKCRPAGCSVERSGFRSLGRRSEQFFALFYCT